MSLAQLKDAIRHSVSGIPPEMLFDAVQIVFDRLMVVLISDRCSHSEGVTFRH